MGRFMLLQPRSICWQVVLRCGPSYNGHSHKVRIDCGVARLCCTLPAPQSVRIFFRPIHSAKKKPVLGTSARKHSMLARPCDPLRRMQARLSCTLVVRFCCQTVAASPTAVCVNRCPKTWTVGKRSAAVAFHIWLCAWVSKTHMAHARFRPAFGACPCMQARQLTILDILFRMSKREIGGPCATRFLHIPIHSKPTHHTLVQKVLYGNEDAQYIDIERRRCAWPFIALVRAQP